MKRFERWMRGPSRLPAVWWSAILGAVTVALMACALFHWEALWLLGQVPYLFLAVRHGIVWRHKVDGHGR
jgi:hypothetical protein